MVDVEARVDVHNTLDYVVEQIYALGPGGPPSVHAGETRARGQRPERRKDEMLLYKS